MRSAVIPRKATTSSIPPFPGVATSSSVDAVSLSQAPGRRPVSAFSRFAP